MLSSTGNPADRSRVEEAVRREIADLLERIPRLSDMQLAALVNVLRAAQPDRETLM